MQACFYAMLLFAAHAAVPIESCAIDSPPIGVEKDLRRLPPHAFEGCMSWSFEHSTLWLRGSGERSDAAWLDTDTPGFEHAAWEVWACIATTVRIDGRDYQPAAVRLLGSLSPHGRTGHMGEYDLRFFADLPLTLESVAGCGHTHGPTPLASDHAWLRVTHRVQDHWAIEYHVVRDSIPSDGYCRQFYEVCDDARDCHFGIKSLAYWDVAARAWPREAGEARGRPRPIE